MTLKQGVMVSPVEPKWVGPCAQVFDRLRLTGLFYMPLLQHVMGRNEELSPERLKNLFTNMHSLLIDTSTVQDDKPVY